MLVPESDKEVKGSDDEDSSELTYKVSGTEDEDKMLNGFAVGMSDPHLKQKLVMISQLGKYIHLYSLSNRVF
jgi:hypothetical protein